MSTKIFPRGGDRANPGINAMTDWHPLSNNCSELEDVFVNFKGTVVIRESYVVVSIQNRWSLQFTDFSPSRV